MKTNRREEVARSLWEAEPSARRMMKRAIDALAESGYAVAPVAATEAMPEPSARANGGAA